MTIRQYIPTLDGWRAIAILLVVLHHEQLHQMGPFSTAWFYKNGWVGVDIFFAISGLLICTLLLNEEKETGTINLRGFYERRVFRILPAAFTYLSVLAILRVAGLITALTPLDWIGSLFFFRNWISIAPDHWYTNHFWSLAVEEHFYLFLPGFLFFCKRLRTLILGVAGILMIGAGVALAHEGALPSPVGFSDFRLGPLLLAAAAAIALKNDRVRELARRFCKPILMLAGVAVALTFHFTAHSIVLSVLLTAMVAGTMLNPKSVIGRVLENKVLRFIGKRSYSFYLWQQLFEMSHFGPGADFKYLQQWPVSVLCGFACACLSYSFVEQPMIKLGRRLSAPRAELPREQQLVA